MVVGPALVLTVISGWAPAMPRSRNTPQDDASLGGKVLRIDRDGAAAPGNAGGYRWFSKGHRNVQGIAFRSRDDLGVSAEHGPSIDDEVNLLLPGNFGWDPVPATTNRFR